MEESTKVIFLDIDGVLNSEQYFEDVYFEYQKTGKKPSHHLVDSKPLQLLLNYLNNSDTKLVISSSWRYSNDPEETIKQFFNFDKNGDNISLLNKFIIGCTPRSREGIRGKEIQWWLDRHPEVSKYVIIDDDNDMLDSQRKYFVKTSFKTGLLPEHINKVDTILNKLS